MGKILAVLLFLATVGCSHANPPTPAVSKVPTVEELEQKLAEMEVTISDNQVTMSKEGFIAIIQYVKAMNAEIENSKRPREVVCHKVSQ